MEIKIWNLKFLILFQLIYQIHCLEPIPQIKVVGTQIAYVNPEYFSKMVFTVNRFNATFNYVKIFWNITKDLPADLKVYTKVYITTTTYQTGTLALDDVTPVCEPSSKRKLLPNLFKVSKSELNSECIRQGVYVLPNLIQFRFEVLLPDIEKRGNYYRVDYKFGTNGTTISKFTFYNEWGYHNTM